MSVSKFLLVAPLTLAVTLALSFCLSPFVGYVAGISFALAVQAMFWHLFLHRRSESSDGAN